MKNLISVAALLLIYMVFTLSSCAVQEEMTAPAKPAPIVEAKKVPPPEKAPAVKAKALKTKGDVGLLDLEKNYLILVTKEGKLITADFSDKTKVTKIVPTASKMEDIGLGSSASVEYQSKGEKKIVTKVEYKGAKGGE
ncbi:MAG: hypothetical protein A2W66_12395 [Deltaproteobacteria bacterium RIFCSPLOWO2_02_56_12]|nr:MAG: hypothetical protein A2W66_12395 [Deltaproteobacteria bacterium RIFCSPLOWO2_02_56_12]